MSAFDDNPFADPSVQAAANSGGRQATLDNYDPFGKQQQTTTGGGGAPPPIPAQEVKSGPAVMSPTQDPPPPYQPSAQQTITSADFQRRQEELERKAAELSRREEELKNSGYNARVNNWPPLPSFIPIQPCFYQDINVDIPVEFQEIVKRLYYLWIFHSLVMLVNLFGGACTLFVGQDRGTMIGLGILYAFFFIPLSFVCWFRPAYKAFRSDSSVNFMVFFFVFFCQFCFSIIMALGIPDSGFSGLIMAISVFQTQNSTGGTVFTGIVLIFVATGFILCALGDFFMLTKIHTLYRASGASISKAQAEFTSHVLSNESVRNAAAQAAASSVRSNFGGQNAQSDARY